MRLQGRSCPWASSERLLPAQSGGPGEGARPCGPKRVRIQRHPCHRAADREPDATFATLSSTAEGPFEKRPNPHLDGMHAASLLIMTNHYARWWPLLVAISSFVAITVSIPR